MQIEEQKQHSARSSLWTYFRKERLRYSSLRRFKGLQTSLFLAALLVCGSVLTRAATQTHPFVDCTPNPLDSDLISGQKPIVNYSEASIYKDNVAALLEKTIAYQLNLTSNGKVEGMPKGGNEYVVIHVVKWKDLASGATAQEIDKQNWYIYHDGKWTDEDFSQNKRIFGVDHIWLLYIHLNKDQTINYRSDYSIMVTSKLPTNLNNLFQLLGAFSSIGAVTPTAARAPGPPPNIYDFARLPVDFKTSDIDIKPVFELMKDSSCSTSAGDQAKNVTPIKVDNEGKAFFDFSVGVPIRKISQLQFNTDQTIAAQKIDTTNAFALLNLYVPKVDLKHTTFSWIPHFVGGLAVAKQPLHRGLVGVGWGPYFAQFYIGAALVTEQAPTGSSCGSAVVPNAKTKLANRICPQLSYGLNVPLGGLVQALKKTSK